jgi:hypothetical protein
VNTKTLVQTLSSFIFFFLAFFVSEAGVSVVLGFDFRVRDGQQQESKSVGDDCWFDR